MNALAQFIRKLHHDDRGAIAFETVLIIAALVLPMLLLLFLYGADLRDWIAELWEDVRTDSEDLVE